MPQMSKCQFKKSLGIRTANQDGTKRRQAMDAMIEIAEIVELFDKFFKEAITERLQWAIVNTL